MRKNCPICKSSDKNNKVFIEKNIDYKKINDFSFSSRKTPEFMNFKFLKCGSCSLIYTTDIPNFKEIKKLYNKTAYISKQNSLSASKTYFEYLKKNLKIKNKDNALEIGTGNGVFLSFLKKIRFKNVLGIEPSKNAILHSSNYLKKNIVYGMFEETKIKKNKYNLICCFMTMEHVYHPNKVLLKSYNSLKKKGFIALVTHDAGNILHKILKKKSPIIDIEHLQLFNKKSIKSALVRNGFKNIKIINIKNSYHLSYWITLLPISPKFKKLILSIIKKYFLIFDIKISINVGNIMTIAEKL